jgi:hypothetical protein
LLTVLLILENEIWEKDDYITNNKVYVPIIHHSMKEWLKLFRTIKISFKYFE